MERKQKERTFLFDVLGKMASQQTLSKMHLIPQTCLTIFHRRFVEQHLWKYKNTRENSRVNLIKISVVGKVSSRRRGEESRRVFVLRRVQVALRRALNKNRSRLLIFAAMYFCKPLVFTDFRRITVRVPRHEGTV